MDESKLSQCDLKIQKFANEYGTFIVISHKVFEYPKPQILFSQFQRK